MDFGIARAVAERGVDHDADRPPSSAPPSTCPPSRRAARRSTPAPTSTRPAACSSSCSAGSRRSSGTARSAWPTSTSARTPKAPSLSNRDVPPAVDAIVLKALAKNPLNRYQSAAEMRADVLRAAAGRPVYAEPVMSDARAARPAARSPHGQRRKSAGAGAGGRQPSPADLEHGHRWRSRRVGRGGRDHADPRAHRVQRSRTRRPCRS